MTSSCPTEPARPRERRGINGAALKWFAVVTMFIDHAAYVFFRIWYRTGHVRTALSHGLYVTLRGIGRFAFPIYCFLLVEGYLHTRSKPRYLGRLAAFALLSEIPFDLAFESGWLDLSSQNVYFTLALGLAAIWLWDAITLGDVKNCRRWRVPLALLAVAAMGAAARFLHTDYGWKGVLVIVLLYWWRDHPWIRFFTAGPVLLASSMLEAVSFPDFLLFHLYNGERGRQAKYFFYFFYPCHLALLGAIRYLVTGF